MTRWPALERLLATDPKDVGCDEAMALLQRAAGEQIEIKTVLASDLRTTRADPSQVE